MLLAVLHKQEELLIIFIKKCILFPKIANNNNQKEKQKNYLGGYV